MSDLIDRQAALNAITDELMPSTSLSAVIRAKNRLKDLPAVQPILTCEGCRYNGYYKQMRCRGCLRKEPDLYEPE